MMICFYYFYFLLFLASSLVITKELPEQLRTRSALYGFKGPLFGGCGPSNYNLNGVVLESTVPKKVLGAVTEDVRKKLEAARKETPPAAAAAAETKPSSAAINADKEKSLSGRFMRVFQSKNKENAEPKNENNNPSKDNPANKFPAAKSDDKENGRGIKAPVKTKSQASIDHSSMARSDERGFLPPPLIHGRYEAVHKGDYEASKGLAGLVDDENYKQHYIHQKSPHKARSSSPIKKPEEHAKPPNYQKDNGYPIHMLVGNAIHSEHSSNAKAAATSSVSVPKDFIAPSWVANQHLAAENGGNQAKVDLFGGLSEAARRRLSRAHGIPQKGVVDASLQLGKAVEKSIAERSMETISEFAKQGMKSARGRGGRVGAASVLLNTGIRQIAKSPQRFIPSPGQVKSAATRFFPSPVHRVSQVVSNFN